MSSMNGGASRPAKAAGDDAEEAHLARVGSTCSDLSKMALISDTIFDGDIEMNGEVIEPARGDVAHTNSLRIEVLDNEDPEEHQPPPRWKGKGKATRFESEKDGVGSEETDVMSRPIGVAARSSAARSGYDPRPARSSQTFGTGSPGSGSKLGDMGPPPLQASLPKRALHGFSKIGNVNDARGERRLRSAGPIEVPSMETDRVGSGLEPRSLMRGGRGGDRGTIKPSKLDLVETVAI